MCMSPHEISTRRIEEIVVEIQEQLAAGAWGRPGDYWYKVWTGRLVNYEKLLKERAEAGTL